MTKEEAIHILANLKPTNTKSSFDAYVVGKAITMAIEALEQESSEQECKNCKHYPDDDETCLECEYEGVTRGYTKYEQEPSGDLISRQAAIKAIEERAKQIKNEDTLNGLAGAVAILFELPSVKPQKPKTGHWIDDNADEIDAKYGRHLYKCSECNRYAEDFVGGHEDWWDVDMPNYCPYCGVKMVEPQESEDENNGR